MSWLREIWRAHQALPRLLRLQWIVPFTLALVFVGGRFFELPPGPLCDEGMVLFMEGGCDFGLSNVFFFSKLGLLLALNVGFAVAWLRGVRGYLGFVPHFAVASCLAAATWSGGRCDTYYSHPNGSLGQMVLELAAFAVLGIAVLMRWQGKSVWRLVTALLAWNFLHVALFYTGLGLFPHWTWVHTGLVVAGLVAVARLVSPRRSPEPAPAGRQGTSNG